MTTATAQPRPIGDGLVLRWSTAADAEKISNFAAQTFRSSEDGAPNEPIRDTVTRWMRGDYPFMGPGDFVIVEDTGRDENPVVACACYLQEEWTFDDIPIAVCRPEIVASDPEYRHRGLIRTIFDELHARAATEGRPLQAITGIPYFYRQFGYEYALDLGGSTTVPTDLVPSLPDGEDEACTFRLATHVDVPMIADWHRAHFADSLVACAIPDSFWRYRIDAEDERSGSDEPSWHRRLCVIEADGRPCGFAFVPQHRSGDSYGTGLLVFEPGTQVHRLTPSIMRALKDAGEKAPTSNPETPLRKLTLNLGRSHPIYRALPDAWLPRTDPPYAWYVRIPDLPGFLRHIAPVIEQRLAASDFAGYDGDLTLTFYRSGLRLKFADGKLDDASEVNIGPFDRSAKAGVPQLVFLRLLLGYESAEELVAGNHDVWVADDARALIDVLFPKVASRVYDI